MIDTLQESIPNVRKSMLTALGNVVGSHLLDRDLFDFRALRAGEGSIANELDAAVGVHDLDGAPLAEPALVSLSLEGR